jgi:carboxylesterase type B
LRAKPAEEVMKARGGQPIIDGWFIPDDPGNIFAEGKQNDVPLLVGSNKDEGTFFLQKGPADRFLEKFAAALRRSGGHIIQAVPRRIGR